jgi:hypothetical protein
MAAPDLDLRVTTASGTVDVSLARLLTPELAEAADEAANAWIKALRGLPIDGTPFRERFTFRGDSLWWFAELYLHKTQIVDRIFRALLPLDALVSRERVVSIEVLATDAVVRQVTWALCRREGIRFVGTAPGPLRREMATVTARAHYYVWRSRLAAWGTPARVPLVSPTTMAAFVHSAFWRGGTDEQYVGSVMRELGARLPAGALAAVGLGPRTSYRARTWKRRVADATDLMAHGLAPESIDTFAPMDRLRESQDVWRRRGEYREALLRSALVQEAAVIRGCDTWPLLEPVFLGVAYLQFPWSAHVMDQLGAALDVLQPRVAVTYAEAGGWGRALVLEARRRGIATVGLQHGFIYRHWMNYHHDADEVVPSTCNVSDTGFPAPTLTLLYDRLAAAHLRRAGNFAEESLAVTGSPRLDELAAAARQLTPADLTRVREQAGVPAGRRMVLVAAKYTQIAGVFPDLVRAIPSMNDVHLVVKRHPAEGPDGYMNAAAGSPTMTVAPSSLGLAPLTRASDLLVTVNSTASIEAMVMGVPTLVLALPNNLSPFVDAGVMAGVQSGGDVAAALRAALAPGAARDAWRERAEAFMQREGIQADGQAVARAADAIVRLAGARRGRDK